MPFKSTKIDPKTLRPRMRGAFMRWKKYHERPLKDILYHKVQVGQLDECWPWIGECNQYGYGQFRFFHGKTRKGTSAHRVAYELEYGPIAPGAFICHRCDNPRCCNPRHLFLGSQKDNMQDCVSKGRLNPARGEKKWGAKMTSGRVREMRDLYAVGDYSYASIGKLYGLSKSGAGHIVSRRKWAHVT